MYFPFSTCKTRLSLNLCSVTYLVFHLERMPTASLSLCFFIPKMGVIVSNSWIISGMQLPQFLPHGKHLKIVVVIIIILFLSLLVL